MKNCLISYLYLVVAFTSFGCCSERLPLCLTMSRTKPSVQPNIGETLYEVCKAKHITITVLSSSVAEFRGSRKNMKWLQDNYRILLCDFNEESTSVGGNEAMKCLSHASLWMQIVKSGKLEELMQRNAKYCTDCVPSKVCF